MPFACHTHHRHTHHQHPRNVLVVDVQRWPVAHEKGAHELQRGDLEGEVEGRDERDCTIGEAIAAALLPSVVATHVKAAREEANLVLVARAFDGWTCTA